ncbi:alpha/beta fold hydrolase [Sphingosinithalassobacter portus]|uniref:alpha/beta fold hydrolase n=1 Tax=Stakelama portus TaxID=2676234 RepID=UPI000D6DCA35|nr:alpha/beta fold hydrolase [Sphingosinithalassobacter portus]
MRRIEKFYVTLEGGRQVHGRIARGSGPKPPLLCIHQSPMSGAVFERFLASISDDRTALAFDTPGFGMSDRPAAPPAIADYAADLVEALDIALAPDRFDMFGFHTGSMIAARVGATLPDRARRIAMIGAPILTQEERGELAALYHPPVPDFDGAFLQARWRSFVHHHRRPGVTSEALYEAFREALMGGMDGWWGHRAAFAENFEEALAACRGPVLVLKTGDDLEGPTARAQGRWPHVVVADVPGWGHGFLDFDAACAAQLIERFLDAREDGVSVPPLPASSQGPRYPGKPMPTD